MGFFSYFQNTKFNTSSPFTAYPSNDTSTVICFTFLHSFQDFTSNYVLTPFGAYTSTSFSADNADNADLTRY